MNSNQCPICKRYIGLWDRKGNQVACELHIHSHKEKPNYTSIYAGNRLIFIDEK